MKITLIYPSLSKSSPLMRKWKQPKSHRYPGLGLLYVAALCPQSTDIRLVDDEFEKIPYDEETDLVGITVLTANSNRAYEISNHYRQKGIPVVLGGMHVTSCQEEASNYADSVVVGEAEDTWPELLKDFNAGKLRPMYTSSNDADLANKPFPRRDLVNKTEYTTINTVQATRGCPFNCEFCSITALLGRRTRCRPVEEVVEEIKSLEGTEFLLNDDNLAQKIDYYKELFRRLIPLKKMWVGEASWNIVKDEETLELLRESGCRGLAIGFESLEPQDGVSKIMPSKNIFLLYKEVVRKLHEHNLIVYANFLFGFDNENVTTFEKTLEFALESKIDAAQFGIIKPFPGTPFYKRLIKEGRLTEKKWYNYTGWNVCYKLKNMPERTFLQKFSWITNEFFTYPRILSRVIRASKRTGLYGLGLLFAINRGQRKYIKNFSRQVKSSL